jgi:hypothetical protein
MKSLTNALYQSTKIIAAVGVAAVIGLSYSGNANAETVKALNQNGVCIEYSQNKKGGWGYVEKGKWTKTTSNSYVQKLHDQGKTCADAYSEAGFKTQKYTFGEIDVLRGNVVGLTDKTNRIDNDYNMLNNRVNGIDKKVEALVAQPAIIVPATPKVEPTPAVSIAPVVPAAPYDYFDFVDSLKFDSAKTDIPTQEDKKVESLGYWAAFPDENWFRISDTETKVEPSKFKWELDVGYNTNGPNARVLVGLKDSNWMYGLEFQKRDSSQPAITKTHKLNSSSSQTVVPGLINREITATTDTEKSIYAREPETNLVATYSINNNWRLLGELGQTETTEKNKITSNVDVTLRDPLTGTPIGNNLHAQSTFPINKKPKTAMVIGLGVGYNLSKLSNKLDGLDLEAVLKNVGDFGIDKTVGFTWRF